ncbi:hypothetical protein K449DRAFT_387557 [Hypoxylon sp. EC38]|nr:hypothetical protein K449DRAFT_387557 [Hypoxylon sp. EC38]
MASGKWDRYARPEELIVVPAKTPNPRKIEFLGSWYFVEAKGKEVTWAGVTPLQPEFPLLTPNLISVPREKGCCFQPFASEEWWEWYITRSRDLSTRLDEGEWHGTYTSGLEEGSDIGPPLERIRFRKSGPNGDTYIVEAPSGVDDDFGTFTLHGELKVSDIGYGIHL